MNFQVSYQFSLIFIIYVCLSLLKIQVHGIVRRSSSFNTGRIEHLYKNPQAHIEGSKFLYFLLLPTFRCFQISLFIAHLVTIIHLGLLQ